jgi:hypothetical protein
MEQDEEMHNALMHAFREYFKANQRWINEGTKRAGMDTRFWLNEIKHLALKRRLHIMEWRVWKNEDMRQQKAKRRLEKAQKAAAKGEGNAN